MWIPISYDDGHVVVHLEGPAGTARVGTTAEALPSLARVVALAAAPVAPRCRGCDRPLDVPSLDEEAPACSA